MSVTCSQQSVIKYHNQSIFVTEAQVVNCDVGAGSLLLIACFTAGLPGLLRVTFLGDKVVLVQVLLRVL